MKSKKDQKRLLVTCEQLESLYATFLDNLATREELKLIHDHLMACLRCRSSLAWTRHAMSSGYATPPPRGFRERLLARLRQEASRDA